MPKLLVDNTETKLRVALSRVLRKLGLIGKTTPPDADLLRIADAFAGKSRLFGGRTVGAADDGKTFVFGDCLAPGDPKLDVDIPF